MIAFRMRYRQAGAHVNVRVFCVRGPNVELVGQLTFSPDEWEALRWQTRSTAIEVLPE